MNLELPTLKASMMPQLQQPRMLVCAGDHGLAAAALDRRHPARDGELRVGGSV
ncbi:nicotinate-nucleotide--dimethylbenzimidazole phosphoribosyltransferase [Rhodoferax sediminis]|uniref:nicotinate-nucleotide--dimethylbenzimidazole phosphoribosyltransferase n=1 Tax=Rhodoferax sediminis TaxID=2509614 RepID=UPI00143D256F|nr:nicotinate-nucleotide--dimethylbenzimidazole phosphoribosyltransferase [Rhodoferax sediminis]